MIDMRSLVNSITKSDVNLFALGIVRVELVGRQLYASAVSAGGIAEDYIYPARHHRIYDIL